MLTQHAGAKWLSVLSASSSTIAQSVESRYHSHTKTHTHTPGKGAKPTPVLPARDHYGWPREVTNISGYSTQNHVLSETFLQALSAACRGVWAAWLDYKWASHQQQHFDDVSNFWPHNLKWWVSLLCYQVGSSWSQLIYKTSHFYLLFFRYWKPSFPDVQSTRARKIDVPTEDFITRTSSKPFTI